MITKESRRNGAVIAHFILRIRHYWQVYYAVKGRKKSDMRILLENSHTAYIQFFEP